MNSPSEFTHVGLIERTYTLKTKNGRYAWTYDGPNDRELLEGSWIFDSMKEAQDWHSNHYGGMAVRVKLSP